MKAAASVLLTVVLAVPAFAQTNGTFEFRVSGVASPSNPTITVEVWATWDQQQPEQWAWAGGGFDLHAGSGAWSDSRLLFNGPGSDPGTPAHSALSGVVVTQGGIHRPLVVNTQNAFPLIEALWTTSDFTARSVQLTTDNTQFFILADPVSWFQFNLVPQQFNPGSGVIQVVPAPGAALLAALPLAWARRRRRC